MMWIVKVRGDWNENTCLHEEDKGYSFHTEDEAHTFASSQNGYAEVFFCEPLAPRDTRKIIEFSGFIEFHDGETNEEAMERAEGHLHHAVEGAGGGNFHCTIVEAD
jgi:hypothetical protein